MIRRLAGLLLLVVAGCSWQIPEPLPTDPPPTQVVTQPASEPEPVPFDAPVPSAIPPDALALSTDDSRLFVPRLKSNIPNQTITIGQAVTFNAQFYIACQTVRGSTVGSPHWVMNNGVPGLTINSTTGLVTGTPTGSPSGATTIQCDNDIGGPVVSNPFTYTVQAGGGESLIVAIAQGGRSFFIATSGNTTNAGNTIAAPWNMAKLISFLATGAALPGDDFYFRAGDVFDVSPNDDKITFQIRAGGASASNPMTFGSYFCNNGTSTNCTAPGASPFVNAPTNYTVSRWPHTYTRTVAMPKIRGTYLQSCRTTGDPNAGQTGPTGPWNGKCAWNTKTTGSNPFVLGSRGNYGPGNTHATPRSTNDGLVEWQFSDNKKWVTVQDIEVEGSAGNGVMAYMETIPGAACMANPVCQVEITWRRMKISYSGDQAVNTTMIARINVEQNWLFNARLSGGDRQTGHTNGGGMFVFGGCAPCEVLAQGNSTYNVFGEAFGNYYGSHVMAYGNLIGGSSMSHGGGSQIVYEHNILFGNEPIYHAVPPATYDRFPFWGMVGEAPGNNEKASGRPTWITPANTVDRLGRGFVRRNNIVLAGPVLGENDRPHWSFGLTADRFHRSHFRACPQAVATLNCAGGIQGSGPYPAGITNGDPPTLPPGYLSYILYRTEGGPYVMIDSTVWDIGNTIIIGRQPTAGPAARPIHWDFRDLQPGCNAQYPHPFPQNDDRNIGPGKGAETGENAASGMMGCRADIENGLPASFLRTARIQNNLFIVQDGHTPRVNDYCEFGKGVGGVLTMTHNGFTKAEASTSCGSHLGGSNGTGNVVRADFAGWGITPQDFLGMEWYQGEIPDWDDFVPAASGAGNGAGVVLTGTDPLVLDINDPYWDWVLSKRVWLGCGVTAGSQQPKSEWVKMHTIDYCGNPKGAAPDLGAFNNLL